MDERALNFTMRYEVGPWWVLDGGTRAGYHSTDAEKKKTGYVNDPADPGGKTMYGIAQTAHPGLDIDALNWEKTLKIYETEYWLPAQCDKLPLKLACVQFDCAVNSGVGQAGKLLQTVLGVTSDGQVGPGTLKTVGSAPMATLVPAVLEARRTLCKQIVQNKPLLGRFLAGWLIRINALESFVGTLT